MFTRLRRTLHCCWLQLAPTSACLVTHTQRPPSRSRRRRPRLASCPPRAAPAARRQAESSAGEGTPPPTTTTPASAQQCTLEWIAPKLCKWEERESAVAASATSVEDSRVVRPPPAGRVQSERRPAGGRARSLPPSANEFPIRSSAQLSTRIGGGVRGEDDGVAGRQAGSAGQAGRAPLPPPLQLCLWLPAAKRSERGQ